MLDQYFSRPSAIQRHRNGPLEPYVDGFADFLFTRGYAKQSGGLRIRLISDLSQWLEATHVQLRDLDEMWIAGFLRVRKKHHRPNAADKPTLTMLLEYLRRSEVIPCLQPEGQNPLDELAHDYAQFLAGERGLAPITIHNYLKIIRRFLLSHPGESANSVDMLCFRDVREFIVQESKSACATTLQQTTCALRSFLGYLYQSGKLAMNLAASVPSIANHAFAELPGTLEAPDVEKLLASCDLTSPIGRRDYAVLTLLARLGLRACEIINLTLEDINWDAGELLIRGKGARQDRLPLLQDVGQALANYLKQGRPRCTSRNLFLRIKAPMQGFTGSPAVWAIVSRALVRAQLHPQHRGSHLLRHTLATQMLRRGASLMQIGKILRHQRPQTTRIYAKVDLVTLRSLALPWPGGVK